MVQVTAGVFALPGALIDVRGGFPNGGSGVYTGPDSLASVVLTGIAPIAEPSSLVLLGPGLLGALAAGWLRRGRG
jgi:hypothetical protein